ncbi:MAG TPA: type VI secretion system tip protein TssI/VgrG, partial [Polyangiaceae bacterium]|nr:type VI secretion system tip protein TssI/VgrG [Polyangiaceae bacterium]
LGEWSIDFADECERTYKTRKTRIQYQESDFTFIRRLLEASGITFLFRQENGESKLSLRDAPERHEVHALPLEHVNEPTSGQRFASGFRASRAVRPGKVTFADHDPRMANQPLLGTSKTGDHPVEAQLEHFVYKPGGFKFGGGGPKDTPHADDRGRTRTDPAEAKRIADEAAHARVARSQRFSFESNFLDLMPGQRVSIHRHAIAEKHGELLLTRVSIAGNSQSDVRVSCDAVSASVPYRPEALTPQPAIQGIECATVVGPSGEDIHCDEFGRVRVQFHWDRYGKMDEQSSIWVHVNQPWSGEGFGAINIPRIGQEVMVSFLGGNPEEPMIVGRMHTNLLRPPFALPLNKTQSGIKSKSTPETGGYNELMFEDKAGHELVRRRAEKDEVTRVNNDKTLSVGRHRTMSIEGNDKETVEGNQKNSVFQNMMSAIGKNQLTTVLGNLVSAAGKDRLFQTVGNFVTDALSHRMSAQESNTFTVGKSMIHMGPDFIVIQTPKLFLNPGAEVAQAAALSGKAPTGSTSE